MKDLIISCTLEDCNKYYYTGCDEVGNVYLIKSRKDAKKMDRYEIVDHKAKIREWATKNKYEVFINVHKFN